MKTIYLDYLEKYFNGEMSPEEIEEFELRIREEPELEKAFHEYQQILDALSDKSIIELRSKLKKIREEEPGSGTFYRFLEGNQNLVWLAALLLIVLSFTTVIVLLIKSYDQDLEYVAEYRQDDVQALINLNNELMKYKMRSHGQVILSPNDTNSIFVEGDINFEWAVDSTYNLLLDVIRKDGRVVFVSPRPLESPYVFRMDLDEGIYVFRFRDDKETFSLTVMYVK